VLLSATHGMHYISQSSLAVRTAYRPISIQQIMHCILYVSTQAQHFSHNVFHSLSLFTKLNIIQAIQSTSMKCPGHVAGNGEKRNKYTVLIGKP
jgi:hypothetical protein